MAKEREGGRIRAWLLERGKTVADAAGKAGVSRPLASRTIHGQANNRRVLQALVELGVPRRLLVLPKDMAGAAANEEQPETEASLHDNGGRRVSGRRDRRKGERRQTIHQQEKAQ